MAIDSQGFSVQDGESVQLNGANDLQVTVNTE